jgi:hypothetical protein
MDVDDDTVGSHGANPADDMLARVLRWAGLTFALGLLAVAVAIAG